MHIATVSSQRQITLPKRMLDDMGIGKKDKVELRVEKGEIKMKPMKESITKQLSGSLSHLISEDKKGKSWDEIMSVTRKKVAEKLASEL